MTLPSNDVEATPGGDYYRTVVAQHPSRGRRNSAVEKRRYLLALEAHQRFL